MIIHSLSYPFTWQPWQLETNQRITDLIGDLAKKVIEQDAIAKTQKTVHKAYQVFLVDYRLDHLIQKIQGAYDQAIRKVGMSATPTRKLAAAINSPSYKSEGQIAEDAMGALAKAYQRFDFDSNTLLFFEAIQGVVSAISYSYHDLLLFKLEMELETKAKMGILGILERF